MRRKKKSRLAAAEFLAVLIVTAVVFTKGLSAALAWRGYKAVGGEFMLLLLPIIYYEAKRINLETVCRTCHALIHEGTPPLADGLAFDADGNIITAPHTPRDAPK